jgi:ferrous iron transport protein B
MKANNTICVVGNPNCGKTTLFNALTGSNQTVGNWAGVTVEKKSGSFKLGERRVTLVDLPGIYSLQPTSATSEDERVARDYILTDEAELVLNIVDASNLERNLYLTAQLLEMQVPMLVVVNMLDVAKSHEMKIRLDVLEKKLGCPVIGIIASKEQGLDELKKTIEECLASPKVPANPIVLPEDIAKAQDQIASDLKRQGVSNAPWVAEQILEGDAFMEEYLKGVDTSKIKLVQTALNNKYEGDLDMAIADLRYSFVSSAAEKAIERIGTSSRTVTDKIDRIVLHRWLGIPIFLAVMYVMFIFSINIGSAFIDFFDIFVGAIFVDGFGELLESIGCPIWLKTILADGIGGGIQCVSTFIPVIGCLFLFLSFLEDSGYMARAAFVMDRLMRGLGLPGKSFVPLIVGFGCGVPAIMATRTMEKKKDRITTTLMVPFMSCGARLPVYVLFATVFWPTNGQNLVFSLYIIGIIVAIATGYMLKKTALLGEASAFVMEIPPYHVPTVKNLLLRTWDRLKGFMLRAGKVIVILVAVISFLNSLGTDGSFGNEDTDKSVLSQIGKTIVPVFAPMGIKQENWPAAVGVFTGILAKEAVVGTLDSLYGAMDSKAEEAEEGDKAKEEEEDEGFSLKNSFIEAVESIRDNFAELGSAFADPLGISVGDLSDEEEQAKEQEVAKETMSAMKQLFDGQLGAFAYLMMVLLYLPCGAAIGAIYRETGPAWTSFLALWTTSLGYCGGVLVYQLGTFSAHPTASVIWTVGIVVYLAGVIAALKYMANNTNRMDPTVALQS